MVSAVVHTVAMPGKNTLPPLTPAQVVRLQDELLANADRLLMSAVAVLDLGHVGLARSLAILGMEESGKAIAIHRRRVEIAYAPEGEPFVNTALRKLWADHQAKLKLVHDFLVQEQYWFGTEPSDPEANSDWLGDIEDWTCRHNVLKQRGFYVDVTEQDGVLTPADASDEASLREVISHVHQIGWQIRLGEHIEAKQQAEMARDVPPASEESIEQMRAALGNSSLGDSSDFSEQVLDGMRRGRAGTKWNNDGYRLHLPGAGSDPFANLGKPGYEAETRELLQLADQLGMLPAEEGQAETDTEDQG